MIFLPMISKDILFHVGTLNIKDKNDFNIEGICGLSVSSHPKAWLQINRGLTKGETFILQKDNSLFVDAHAINEDEWTLLFQWGVDNGYLSPCSLYEFSYFDDEMDTELVSLHDSYEEALIESDDQPDAISLKNSFKGTDKFGKIIGNKQEKNIELIVVVYCYEKLQCDGVYWEDTLDILRYSAPRGIILNQKLPEWEITNEK